MLDIVSFVFLFMVAGPFIDKLFLTPNTQSEQERDLPPFFAPASYDTFCIRVCG